MELYAVNFQKRELITRLMQKKQLSLFTATLTDTGRVTYAGASGTHDDYVMSLCLAAWNIRIGKAQYCVSVI